MGKSKSSSSSSAPSKKPAGATSTDTPAPTKPAGRGPPRAKIVRSGNAGNSSSSPAPSSAKAAGASPIVPDDGRPPPLFPAGYKTPLSLLNERCQKNGWQKPDVQPFKTLTGYSCAVKLTKIDLKNGAETVTLQPPTASDSPIKIEKQTSLEAKHWGAVYALHRFASMLQMGMILPPQCRDYWAALQADKKAAPPGDAWKWAADPFQAASSRVNSRTATPTASGSRTPIDSGHASPPTGPTMGKDVPEVRMSPEMRKLVQSTIRTMRKLYPPSRGPDDARPYAVTAKERSKIVKSLGALGYREGHVESALDYVASTSPTCDPLLEGLSENTLQDTVIQYLQITLTEEELPAAHGFANKNADAGVRISNRDDASALAQSWRVEKIVKETGYPEASVAASLRDAEGDEALAIDVLSRRLVGWEDEWSADALLVVPNATAEERKDVEERRKTELEALQSILGSAFHTIDSSSFEIDIAPARTSLTLRVLLHNRNQYPASIPTLSQAPYIPCFYLASVDNEVPAYIRLHLVASLMQRLRDPDQPDWLELVEAGEGGLIYEMVAYLEETLEEVLRNPPPAEQILRHLNGEDVRSGEGYARANGDSKSSRASKVAKRSHVRAGDHALLLTQHHQLEKTSEYQAMLSKRKTLPAWKAKQALIDLVSANRVVIVAGATGSGKTTQVPAFVLANEILRQRGGATSIICTQPRRISAIGVASRVAQERTEKVGENLVGYAIRGERKASKNCRLLFCTTGILLQRISRGGDPDLEGVSHVFVDEVHERSLDSDFLLLILKELLSRNKTIKVVLMSATADSARFSAYFGGAPCIKIPGQTHPVEDFYLEDVITATRYKAPSIKASRTYTQEENDALKESIVGQGITNPDEISTLSMMTRAEKLDYELIAHTVRYLMSGSEASEAILIFVTGVAEITATIRAIERVTSNHTVEVLPLHANLSSADQSRIFKSTSRRKIIVATNIAETSITVDDVVFVIDTGRVKETRFDPEKGLVKLVEDWNSLAGSRQRRGRAGRTKPGKCYKLFTRYTEAHAIPAQSQPEILRTPLASLILQIKSLIGTGDVVAFLQKALDCPEVVAIHEALETLERLGATESGDSKTAKLTPLGQNLALLPLDLRLGKMLILASIFDCLEPVLTICAALSTKSVFSAPPEKRDEAAAARMGYSRSKSDILTDLAAIEAALGVKETSKARRYCEEHFISQAALREILSLKVDYTSALKQAGFFVPPAGSRKADAELEKMDNLLKAIVYAGTGRAVRVKLPQTKYEATIGGTSQLDHESREIRFFDTDGRVFVHPGSILFKETKFKNGYLTYFNKSVTSKPFLRDASELPLYSLLIFGRDLKADALRGGLTLNDGKIRLRAPPRTSVLVNELRRLLDVELAYMIDDPESTRENSHSPVITTMMQLIERDGS